MCSSGQGCCVLRGGMPRRLAATLRSARTKRPEEVTPLCRASRDGDLGEVSSLLVAYTGPESLEAGQHAEDLRMAAQLAAAHGHAPVLQAILKAGEHLVDMVTCAKGRRE